MRVWCAQCFGVAPPSVCTPPDRLCGTGRSAGRGAASNVLQVLPSPTFRLRSCQKRSRLHRTRTPQPGWRRVSSNVLNLSCPELIWSLGVKNTAYRSCACVKVTNLSTLRSALRFAFCILHVGFGPVYPYPRVFHFVGFLRCVSGWRLYFSH